MKGLAYAALAAIVIYFILEWKAGGSVSVPSNTLAATLPSGVTTANQVVVNSGGPNNPGAGSLGATPVLVSVQGAGDTTCPSCGHNNMVSVISPVSRIKTGLGSTGATIRFGGGLATGAPKPSGGIATGPPPEQSSPISSGTVYIAGVN